VRIVENHGHDSQGPQNDGLFSKKRKHAIEVTEGKLEDYAREFRAQGRGDPEGEMETGRLKRKERKRWHRERWGQGSPGHRRKTRGKKSSDCSFAVPGDEGGTP